MEKIASKLELERILKQHEEEMRLREERFEAERLQKIKDEEAREERFSKLYI